MRQLTLLGTIHQNTEKYNSQHLYDVIEKAHPEVLFEELPPEMFTPIESRVITEESESVAQEFTAITKYEQTNNIKVFPIDLPDRNKIYAETITSEGQKKVFNFLYLLQSNPQISNTEKESLEHYFDVLDEQKKLTEEGTFSQVNSGRMSSLVREKHLFQKYIGVMLLDKYSDDKSLKQVLMNYEKWFEDREMHMESVLYKWMQKFSIGVAVVGADHVIGLFEKLLVHRDLNLFINP